MGQGSCFPHQKLSSLVPLLTNLTDVTRQYDTEPDVVPVFWVRPFILEWHASNLTRGHSHGGGCLSETIWNGPGLISSKKRTWRSAFWGFGKFLGHTSGLYKKRESRSGQNGPPIRCHSPWRSLDSTTNRESVRRIQHDPPNFLMLDMRAPRDCLRGRYLPSGNLT